MIRTSVSLVEDYGSDSASDHGDDASDLQTTTTIPKIAAFFRPPAGGIDSSSSDEDSDDDTSSKRSKHAPVAVQAETRPNLLPSAASALGFERMSDIFETVKSHEDAAHEAMLSRHVQMSEKAAVTPKSAAPCRAFKRGRCNRGDRCRFSHDLRRLDLTTIANPVSSASSTSSSKPRNDDGNDESEFAHMEAPTQYTGAAVTYNQWEMPEKPIKKPGNKKRVGVTDSLEPPKKATAAFQRQKKAQAASFGAFKAYGKKSGKVRFDDF